MTPDARLDLKGVPCPANAARTLVKLGAMNEGEMLEVIIDAGEALKNVPESVTQEGHAVLRKEQCGDMWRILIKVGGEDNP